MAHQVFVGITQEVVAVGLVARQIQHFKVADEVAQAVHHVFAAAELVGVVEVGLVNYALQVVGGGDFGDDLVELVADFLVVFQRGDVGEGTACGDVYQAAVVLPCFVGDVFEKQ